MPLTCIDEVDIAIGSPTLSDACAINIRQQAFDSKCARVQGNLSHRRTRPSVARSIMRWLEMTSEREAISQ